MREIEPRAQDEWLKLLTDEQLVALEQSCGGPDLSGLSLEELNRILAGDLEPLRKLHTEEEFEDLLKQQRGEA